MKLALTRAAQHDLLEIGRSTQRVWGKRQRVIYLEALDTTFRLLAEHPGIGTDCSEIRAKYRKHPCQKHIVYYKLTDNDTVLIVRILHSAMDAVRHLPPDTVQ